MNVALARLRAAFDVATGADEVTALGHADGDPTAEAQRLATADWPARPALDEALAQDATAVARSRTLALTGLHRSRLHQLAAALRGPGNRHDRSLWDALRELIEAREHDAAVQLARELLPDLLRPDRWSQTRAYLAVEVARTFQIVRDATRAHEILDRIDQEVVDPSALTRIAAAGIRGHVHLGAGSPDLAEQHFRAAREHAERLQLRDGQGSITLDVAWFNEVQFYVGINRPERVLSRLDELTRDPRWNGLTLGRRAHYMLARGMAENQLWLTPRRRASPVTSYRTALEWAREARDRDAVQLVHIAWARFELKYGDAAEARRLLAELELPPGDSIPSPVATKAATLMAKLDRQRAGTTAAQLSVTRDRLAKLYTQLLDQWARHASGESGNGFLLYDERRELLDELCRHELLLADSETGWVRVLEHLVAAQEQGRLTRLLGRSAPADLRTLCSRIEHGDGLLFYLPPTPMGSLVVAVDRAGAVIGEVADWEALREVREQWLACLTRGHERPEVWRNDVAAREALVAEERRLAQRLAAGLLPPEIRTRLALWQRLSIVGADTLGFVPFEWLPSDGEEFLGARVALVTLPSFPALFERPPPARPALDYLLVGGVEEQIASGPAAGLPPLPISRAELDRLCEPFLPSVSTLLKEDATRTRVTEALTRGAVLSHFLVHGAFDLARTRPASLVLTPDGAHDDGLLRCEHLDGEELNLIMVVLTACKSGFGVWRAGDANAGDLAGAFLASSARTVLVSHSDLRWGTGLEFFVRFSRSMRVDGLAPAEALRVERARLVEADGAMAPSRLPLFELLGDGHRPLFEARAALDRRAWHERPSVAWSALGIALIIALALTLAKRQA